jgi:UDP-2-acetamido-3-amino-2,3-dideoxy-glucuronate N-acetyltransferase
MGNTINKSKVSVAVAGVGYWGKNLVRNFHDLGVLIALCDGEAAVEAKCQQQFG